MIEDIEGEVWKSIPGFNGRYMVSNMGRIKSLRYGRWNHGEHLIALAKVKGYLKFCTRGSDGDKV